MRKGSARKISITDITPKNGFENSSYSSNILVKTSEDADENKVVRKYFQVRKITAKISNPFHYSVLGSSGYVSGILARK